MVSRKIVRRGVLTLIAGASIALFAPGVASADAYYGEGELYAGDGGAGGYSVTSVVTVDGSTYYETTYFHAGPDGAYSTTVRSAAN
ncbi:hypothetical protein J4H86_20575 [Spiractinospora alimapuensis]|uniref:hypothetical protein n=1 Tax=Spiractinospora alimapuensis TaxID=2820884 RepID=UPI001F1875D4|nr:hypothetical protein [Spiractinospora alimapuensis]QVQ51196.1 hypothetical protein J4H86_20575 [Spiractinospora alimapuensis]